MRFLITGAAGFIGMHLSIRLLDMGHEVIGIDNLNSYYNVKLKKDRLKLLHSKNYQFIFFELDILDFKNLNLIFKQNDIDYVIHLAAQAGVRYSLENPKAYIDTNLVGFYNILEMCKAYPIKHFFYASSSSVYGLNENHPWKETDDTDSPVALYGATKKSNELMAFSYSNLYNIKSTGMRFFTVYGPWGRPDMSLFIFTKSIFENTEIKLFNNGDMVRDFTYVDDVVESIIRLLKNDFTYEKPNYYHEVFNIGSGKPIKLIDYLTLIEKEIGRKGVIKYLPMQKGDIKITSANSNKLRDFVDFSPTKSVNEGIKHFVQWYKKYYISQ